MATTKAFKFVGQRYPNVDGVAKVTGTLQYSADVVIPGALYGKILRSPHAHARIGKIDASRALELPGVHAVVTGADFTSVAKDAAAPMGEVEMGLYYMSKLMMAREKALFHGHAIAAVAASTPEVAEEALGLIEVDYEVLPPVLDPVEAMKPTAPLLHDDLFTRGLEGASNKPSNVALHVVMDRGNVDQGFAQADVVVEHTYRTGVFHPGYIEPETEAAAIQTDGRIVVWANTRGMFFHRNQLAVLLGVNPGRIKVIPTEMGGAFGAKAYALLSPVAVMLAMKSGKPVKITLSRDEVLKAMPPAPGSVTIVKVGATKDGKITAIKGNLIFDAGAFPGSALMGGVLSGFAPYKTPNLRIDGYDVVTNKPRVGSVRAPGAPTAAFAVEQAIDAVAHRLNVDPIELRLKNGVDVGDPLPNNIPIDKHGLKELLQSTMKHPAWTTPLKGANQGRGVALGFWRGGVGTSSCHLTVNMDGTVNMTVGVMDMTPTRTGFVQMLADLLEIPAENIRVVLGDTDTAAHSDATGGSRITYSMSQSIYLAAQDLIQQLKQRAAAKLNVPIDQVDYAEGLFYVKGSPDKRVSFKEAAYLSIRGGGSVLARGSNSRMKAAPVFSLGIADVEVDPETGKVKVLKYTAFQDVGKAINPTLVEGQMQGGAAQGIGWVLTEELVYDEKGVLCNPSLLDYRMPTALDLPMIDTVILEVPAADGPFGARGVGEAPCVPSPAAIANAVFRATGVRFTQSPITPERVLKGLKEKTKVASKR